MESQNSFVSWFRDSSPYIHAHRNKTFVISFRGEAVLDDDFDHHVLKRDGGLQPVRQAKLVIFLQGESPCLEFKGMNS